MGEDAHLEMAYEDRWCDHSGFDPDYWELHEGEGFEPDFEEDDE